MADPSRRTLTLAAAAGLLSPGLLCATRAVAQPPANLQDSARQMWLYTLPLIEVARARGTRPPALPAGLPMFNVLLHSPTLAGPNQHTVTTPNCDTLYSQAWIDLRAGPARITLPPSGDRYQSVACMDMYSNNFAVVDMTHYSGVGGTFTLLPPAALKPAPGARDVYRSETRWVWVLCRTLAGGPSDMAAARAAQTGIKLEITPEPNARPAPSIARSAPWQDYFTTAQGLLSESPPPQSQADILTRCAALGLAPDTPFDPSRFTPAQAAQIAAGVQAAQSALKAAVEASDGLTGDFGNDYLKRAVIALSGLAALPSSQAAYMRVPPLMGLTGEKTYRLSFTKDQLPPARAFWSVSMYEVTPDKQLYFRENPIHRYAIGDRTPGLQWRPDGGLDIWIGAADPGDDKTANWLPSPTSGPFALLLRGYLPQPAMLNGTYKPPTVVAV